MPEKPISIFQLKGSEDKIKKSIILQKIDILSGCFKIGSSNKLTEDGYGYSLCTEKTQWKHFNDLKL